MGEKVYINSTGHINKMAAMLNGKNLKKSNRPRYQVSVYRTIGPLVSSLALVIHHCTLYLSKGQFLYNTVSGP